MDGDFGVTRNPSSCKLLPLSRVNSRVTGTVPRNHPIKPLAFPYRKTFVHGIVQVARTIFPGVVGKMAYFTRNCFHDDLC